MGGTVIGAWVTDGLQKQLRILHNQYNRLLKLQGQKEGRIELRIALNAQGEVIEVNIIKDTLNHSRFQRRLKALIKKAKFNVPSHQGAVKVKVRLSFKTDD